MYLVSITDRFAAPPQSADIPGCRQQPLGSPSRSLVVSDGVTRTTIALPDEVAERLPETEVGFVELLMAIGDVEPETPPTVRSETAAPRSA